MCFVIFVYGENIQIKATPKVNVSNQKVPAIDFFYLVFFPDRSSL
jgi:hypothetical protein